MILRTFAIAVAIMTTACSTRPAVQKPGAKPGFVERAWNGTKSGSLAVWETTKSGAGKGWQATRDLVTSPFSKRKDAKPASTGKHVFETVINVSPEAVKLGTVRSVDVTVAITNRGKHSVHLDFPTSQHLELVVKNETGTVLQRWSDDQRIEKEASFVAVNPGERIEYTTTLSTRNMVAGKTYIIESSVPGHAVITGRKVIVPQ